MKSKKIKSYFAPMAIVIFFVQLSGCSSKATDPTATPPPTAQEEVVAKLTANKWNLQTAVVDGVDKTTTYAGLSITFSSGNYTTIKGEGLWATSGTWSFINADGTAIKRDDDTIMTVQVTDTTLKLSFNWTKTTLSGGRIESIKGQHELNFIK